MHCRQGWAHLNLSQTALVSLMAATQIRRVKGDTDLRCCRGEHPTGRFNPQSLPFMLFQSGEDRKVYVENTVYKSIRQHQQCQGLKYKHTQIAALTRCLAASPGHNVLLSSTHTQIYTDTHSYILQGGRSHLVLALSASQSLLSRGCLRLHVYTSFYIRTDVKLNCICLSFLASSFDFTLPLLCLHSTQRVCFETGGFSGEETDEQNICSFPWRTLRAVFIQL